jgi:hypothetical protein
MAYTHMDIPLLSVRSGLLSNLKREGYDITSSSKYYKKKKIVCLANEWELR